MLLASIPRDLRLDTTRATLALARTTFASLIHDTKVDWYPFQASNAHELEFNITASNVISDLISAAGWDPGSMTASQMDDVDIRVECVTCARTYGYIWKPIMPWRYVVSHRDRIPLTLLYLHHTPPVCACLRTFAGSRFTSESGLAISRIRREAVLHRGSGIDERHATKELGMRALSFLFAAPESHILYQSCGTGTPCFRVSHFLIIFFTPFVIDTM